MGRRPAASALFALALAGCGGDIQGSGYPGDPIARLAGSLVWTTDQLPPTQIVLQWQKEPAPSLQPAVTGAWTEPGLADASSNSAPFTLPVYYPPPPEVFQPLFAGEVPIARGNVAAAPYGYPDAWIDEAVRNHSSAYGADVYHWILFSYADVPASSVTAWWTNTLGAGLAAGPHVFLVRPLDPFCVPGEFDACVATLESLGVTDDGTTGAGTARGFCAAPYRLAEVGLDTGFTVPLGTSELPAGACPP